MARQPSLLRRPLFTLGHPVLALMLALVACSPAAMNSVGQLQSAVQPAVHSQVKGPYQGPISLKIDTGLASGKPGKVVDLSALETDDFAIQANSQTPALFEETQDAQGPAKEITRSFRVSDTSQRYSLQVERGTPATGVEVNLNGTTWIRPQSFGGAKRQAQVTTLLLQASNSIRIRTWGQGKVTVRVIAGGSAGTVFRRQHGPNDRLLTQEERLRRNDVNIFNPDDPDSLGGLQPYEGDETLGVGDSAQSIGTSVANGTLARMVVGELTAVVKPPLQEHLQAMLERYPVQVISQESSYDDLLVKLRIDLERVSLSNPAANFEKLNQRVDMPALTDAQFSSVNTAKTIALATDLEANALDLIWGVSLHTVGEAYGSPVETYEEVNSRAAQVSLPPPSIPVKASQLWWLDSIKARDAWNYSLGSGVTVAVIDSDFGIIQENPEFKSLDNQPRVKLSSSVSYLKDSCTVQNDVVTGACLGDDQLPNSADPAGTSGSPNKLYNAPGHGLWVANLLAGGDNNKNGIVGVAPRAHILPMLTSGGSEITITPQLKRLYHENVDVDVVSISRGRYLNLYDVYYAETAYLNSFRAKAGLPQESILQGSPDIAVTPSLMQMYDIIHKLSIDRNVVFVVAAGNKNKAYDPDPSKLRSQTINIPAAMRFVISVGAYEVDNGVPKRAYFDIFTGPEDEDFASDYGAKENSSKSVVWAPGKGLWVQGQEYNSSLDGPGKTPKDVYEPRWTIVEGTSHAAPLVAGAVALMKSWNKDLNLNDVANIFANYSVKLTDSSFRPPGQNLPVDGLDALAAIRHPLVGAKEATSFCLQYKPTDANAKKTIPSITSLIPGIVAGEYFEGQGWSNAEKPSLPANTVELISARKVANCGAADFSVSFEKPANAPSDVQVWLTQGGQRLPVTSNQVVGIGIEAPNMDQIRIEIDGREMPLREVAQNYVLFEVLSNLEPGVKDVVIRYGSQQLTLAQALEYQSAGGCDPNEEWSMRIYNVDDTAKATVNLNELTYGFQADSGFVPINEYLKRGQNDIRFTLFNTSGGYSWGFILKKNNEVIYQSEEGQAGVIGANNNDQSRPNQTVFNKLITVQANICRSIGQPGLSGTAFNNTSLTPPAYSTKVFNQVNFVEGNKYGDQFGIGLTDYFSLRLEGKLSLPLGYPTGTYTLILAHDDGARLVLDNQTLIDAWGPYDYTENARQVQLVQGQEYPLKIEYHENGSEAELGLFWLKPDGTREVVPESALHH